MQSILVVAERDLPLDSLRAFYGCQVVSPTDPKLRQLAAGEGESEFAAAVVCAKSEELALCCATLLREGNPVLPLLFVTDKRNPDSLLPRVAGHGPIRLLHQQADNAEQLLHDVQGLLHPEYPAQAQRIALILPVYNEAGRFENVRNFCTKIRQHLSSAYPQISIFFVNDGSDDGTAELVAQVIADDAEGAFSVHASAPIGISTLPKNTRKAGTYIEGLSGIRADIFVFADSDDSFVVEDIASMINILNDGYWDMVIGTKDATAENRPVLRRAMSWTKRLLTKPLLPEDVYDSQTGLKAFTYSAASHILPYLHTQTGLAIDLEMVHVAHKLNFRILQLPVQCIDREGSHVDVVRDSLRFVRSIGSIYMANRDVAPHAQLARPRVKAAS